MASSRRYAELHLHLEGCIGVETLLEIAPHLERTDVVERLRFDDFSGFLQSFKFAVMHLETANQYRAVARRLFSDLEQQGIVYAEIIHSAGICLWRGLDARAIAEALIEEGRNAHIEIRWIFDAVRQFGEEHVLQTARFTANFAGSTVVGFGVGGDENGCDASRLRPAFQLAREQGLKLMPHAGETSDSANVWDALELGADRIGHGIRAIDDPALLAQLAHRRIPLEISITSNVKTGAVSSYDAHPVKQLHDAGVPIILNTDDPAFFNTNLASEFAHAAHLGFSEEELELVRLNAFRFAAGATPHP